MTENGASVNKKDLTEKTLLWIAALERHCCLSEMLIIYGANFGKEDELRTTVMGVSYESLFAERCLQEQLHYSKIFNLFTLFLN